MAETEKLGKTGWATLAFLVLAIVAVLLWGMSAAIYLGLLGTAVVLVALVLLCLGDTFKLRN